MENKEQYRCLAKHIIEQIDNEELLKMIYSYVSTSYNLFKGADKSQNRKEF